MDSAENSTIPKKTKVGILFFSGAGNTECIARIFERVIASREGCETVFFERITKNLDFDSLEDFDLLGIGFPVYFRRTPQIIYETIGRMDGKRKRLFVFGTKGMYSGNVGRELLKHGQAAGFTPAGCLEIHMPGTDLLLMTKKGGLSERLARGMRSRRIREKVDRFIRELLLDSLTSIPRPKWYTLLDEKGIKPLERLFTKNYQVFKGQYRVLPERCTACLLCVRDCPERNITFLEGKIVFGNNCDLCLRCIHHCPTEAIQLGDKTLRAPRYRPRVTEDGDCRPG